VFGKFLTGNGFTKAADPENGLWQDERGALIKIMQNLIAVREFLAVRSGRQQRAMNNPRAIWSAFEKAHPETTGKSAKAAASERLELQPTGHRKRYRDAVGAVVQRASLRNRSNSFSPTSTSRRMLKRLSATKPESQCPVPEVCQAGYPLGSRRRPQPSRQWPRASR
jgi:hypothetical protein